MDTFEEYSMRLTTYQVESWPLRHYKLTPSKVAKWGLVCKEDSLQCKACMNSFIIEEFDEDDHIRQAQYLRTLNSIKNGHQVNCPYQGRTTRELFKLTSDYMHVNAVNYFKECYNSMGNIVFDQSCLDMIPQDMKVVFHENGAISNRKVMAIFGWSLRQDKLVCKYCGRSCDIYEPFNAYLEHRYYCNWCNESENTKKTFGYIILVKQLYEEYIQNGDPINKITEFVQIGAIRRQIAQQIEQLQKESIEVAQYIENTRKKNQAIQDVVNQRKQFSLESFRKDQQEFEDQLQKKIKLIASEQEQQEQEIEEQQKQVQAKELKEQEELKQQIEDAKQLELQQQQEAEAEEQQKQLVLQEQEKQLQLQQQKQVDEYAQDLDLELGLEDNQVQKMEQDIEHKQNEQSQEQIQEQAQTQIQEHEEQENQKVQIEIQEDQVQVQEIVQEVEIQEQDEEQVQKNKQIQLQLQKAQAEQDKENELLDQQEQTQEQVKQKDQVEPENVQEQVELQPDPQHQISEKMINIAQGQEQRQEQYNELPNQVEKVDLEQIIQIQDKIPQDMEQQQQQQQSQAIEPLVLDAAEQIVIKDKSIQSKQSVQISKSLENNEAQMSLDKSSESQQQQIVIQIDTIDPIDQQVINAEQVNVQILQQSSQGQMELEQNKDDIESLEQSLDLENESPDKQALIPVVEQDNNIAQQINMGMHSNELPPKYDDVEVIDQVDIDNNEKSSESQSQDLEYDGDIHQSLEEGEI